MASKTNLSIHDTEMADMMNQPNAHQMEVSAEDTLNDFTGKTCRYGTTTGRAVVVALPCDQTSFSRGKKARGQLVEGSRSTSKGKRKELCATVPVDHGNLPFQKSENLWGVVESLGTFSIMPQKPHFGPLGSYKEIEREGEALRLMVLFDKITKKALNLRLDAPRDDIKYELSILDKLETHGFDVMKLRDILTRGLLLKDRQEDIENLVKESIRRLTEFDLEKCKDKENGIKRDIEMRKLMEEARLADFRDKEINVKVASDQLASRMIEDELTRIKTQFEELVASLFN
ncbi:DUF724 domain-containing protein 8-like [Apium graveolens]|uniref:DUF724 domain-containing protein 8-like n=1 Tax=Apium graveolens TaxID=4045 RepID=UPI003D79B360